MVAHEIADQSSAPSGPYSRLREAYFGRSDWMVFSLRVRVLTVGQSAHVRPPKREDPPNALRVTHLHIFDKHPDVGIEAATSTHSAQTLRNLRKLYAKKRPPIFTDSIRKGGPPWKTLRNRKWEAWQMTKNRNNQK